MGLNFNRRTPPWCYDAAIAGDLVFEGYVILSAGLGLRYAECVFTEVHCLFSLVQKEGATLDWSEVGFS